MKKKILVVDDELSIRMLLENFLSDDFEVETKENGIEALSWLQEGNQVDLLLVDIDMPMLNGYDFTTAFRKEVNNNVPIIMLSSKQKSADRIKSFTVGADDYLQKPFNPEELMVRIHTIFRRTSAA